MRWYDANPSLSTVLESLKHTEAPRRAQLVSQALQCIQAADANLLERHVASFPLDEHRRRWYDDDPETWLLFNGLRHSSSRVIERVINLLQEPTVQAA